ncbi:DUF676-domain-containing protein [Basidiobolus meristosporus CBS 931.73]|uniref:DUF676-domain-containing protein n=1 Tax=Basidiobolus meristosporus CBS 931.73 TaxID=1314790 RepID=A0A1Y1Y4G5_9FUNG|nr:DUF676-domain-containing protein [Basidiobolus meristosporus CBS 931.73]|eukprot:ORX92484.1 DUF676-domain-containing protein [Basidiobolus meristosporus CBS 931.73]
MQLTSVTGELSVGEIHRYQLTLSSIPPQGVGVLLKVTNQASVVKSLDLFNGCFRFSANCSPADPVRPTLPLTDLSPELQFSPAVNCGATWCIKLPTNMTHFILDLSSELISSDSTIPYKVSISLSGANVSEAAAMEATLTPVETKEIWGALNYEEVKEALHLVILSHGLMGSQLDLLHLKEEIERANISSANTKVVVLAYEVNHRLTMDGVYAGGDRITSKLLKEVEWEERFGGPSATASDSSPTYQISFIGHSLGGVYNLCSIGLLQQRTGGRFFDVFKPCHFVTIASPLLGSVELPWVANQFCAVGGMGQSGRDLMLVDCTEEIDGFTNVAPDSRSILVNMAYPGSPSHHALTKFRNRTAYANTTNDISVGFLTSSLASNFDVSQLVGGGFLSRMFSSRRPIETIVHVEEVELDEPIAEDHLHTQQLPALAIRIANHLQTGMKWTKVLIYMDKITAHTDIIVRRWPRNSDGSKVIQHLLELHPL